MSTDLTVSPELETPAAEPEPVAEPAAAEPEPGVEAAAESAATDEPAQPAGSKKKPGLVEELIAERTLRKQAEGTLRQFAPVLQRLTPEMVQAIQDGRLMVQPPQANADAERQRLAGVAEEVGLYKTDANGHSVPDIDAARKVDALIRKTAREEVAPLKSNVLRERAVANVNTAVTYAGGQGYSPDAVAEIQATYNEVLAQPNGAEMLANPGVAMTVWFQALGRAAAAGKLTQAQTKAASAAAATTTRTPAAVITEPAGRRMPIASAIQLQPEILAVYKNNNLDPAKGVDLSKMKVDRTGAVELE